MPPPNFREELPKPEEYCALRIATGMTPKSLQAATRGLPRSLYAITARDEEGTLIAMGRIIGDETAMQIADVMVHPNYKGQKLGRLIMERIMAFVTENADSTCFVNLFADVDFLYQKFGFGVPRQIQGMRLDRNIKH